MFTTRGGKQWVPEYLVSINGETCIGCGRCFKVCGRDVMHLKGVNEEGALVECTGDDEDDDEFVRKVMILDAPENCIGCRACSRVCPKNCQTHESAVALAT